MFLVFFRVNELKYDWSLLVDEPLVDIAIIRSNSIVYDPRVRKIVGSLSKKYSLATLGWNREARPIEKTDDFSELGLFNLQAPYGKKTLVLYFPAFWIWILFKLIICRPKVVHACDLDTILPCYIYKLIFKKKLVFDVFDRYAMGYVPEKFSLLSSVINRVEESLASRSDVLITVSDKLLKTFRKKPQYCRIIMNCPEGHRIERTKSTQSSFTLVYTGTIIRNRGIERITEAIKDLKGVELLVAGRVIDQDFFDQMTTLPNVKYKGLLLPVDALELEANCDAMVILYDLSLPINNFSMPNKFFEAMKFGIPMITNVAHELVDEIKCGIKVDYNDLNQIKTAIISLRDNKELRKRLGANGRRAFEQKYNWNNMEQDLHRIYHYLLNE
ncbi:MAG: hypothetical protein AUG16_00785 [Thaumarchaeota archaeon 13_1_20CM_2_39_20]|nr:MAG: hypothetical protein AUI92_03700 [Thaumarchaeota archaeon 13_1_40CM_3_38_6]OLD22805.1 MAG: hypothetical protein AUI59_00945 [Thaumarchaeota archaeon 13_1_40CM_2_39_13_1]OLE41210.1 MAG: hypothetical protein AUG16_00785 [Thaumarchaeota archaeon 13_1_20CM_2_39_20]